MPLPLFRLLLILPGHGIGQQRTTPTLGLGSASWAASYEHHAEAHLLVQLHGQRLTHQV
jgi:hypothetical protein